MKLTYVCDDIFVNNPPPCITIIFTNAGNGDVKTEQVRDNMNLYQRHRERKVAR